MQSFCTFKRNTFYRLERLLLIVHLWLYTKCVQLCKRHHSRMQYHLRERQVYKVFSEVLSCFMGCMLNLISLNVHAILVIISLH